MIFRGFLPKQAPNSEVDYIQQNVEELFHYEPTDLTGQIN